jgi:hypothetical protein
MTNQINKPEIIKIFEVHGDGGEWGYGPVIGYATTPYNAKMMAKGKGFFGSEGMYMEVPALTINGVTYVLKKEYPIELNDVQATKDADLRAKTLASLTPEQKRVLGL